MRFPKFMDWRKIIAKLVLIFVGMSLMVKLVVFSTHLIGSNFNSTTQEGSELIAEAAIP